MGLFDRFRKKPTIVKVTETPKTKAPKVPEKTAKELATERGEPYFNVVSMEIDPNNIHAGAFEFEALLNVAVLLLRLHRLWTRLKDV